MRARRHSLRAGWLAAALLAEVVSAQGQAPSGEHRRLPQAVPAGRRETLVVGTLFIPPKLARKKRLPLLVHFHGAAWVAETGAVKDGHWAVISIESGEGSTVYAQQFSDHALFGKMLSEASHKTGIRFSPIVLSAWSAGHGAIREILEVPDYYRTVDKVLLIDGLHTAYAKSAAGEPALDPSHLAIFLKFARDSAAGRKTMLITHSEVVPGAFASTTETADWLLTHLQLRRRPVSKPGPMGMRELSEVRAGKFRLMGYAGNSAEDHVDQFQSLPELMKFLR